MKFWPFVARWLRKVCEHPEGLAVSDLTERQRAQRLTVRSQPVEPAEENCPRPGLDTKDDARESGGNRGCRWRPEEGKLVDQTGIEPVTS
jgi:hypothetical protein